MPRRENDQALTSAEESPGGSGPVMQLLSGGLQRWVRGRCQAVDTLKIKLHGSAFRLLRGRLEGVTVFARRVVYDGVEIEHVSLRSGAIRVLMGNVLSGQPIQLDGRFEIRGTLSFKPEALTRTLASIRWRGLGDSLAEQVLGVVPFQKLEIRNDALVVLAEGVPSGTAVVMETVVAAAGGTLELRSRDGQLRVPLPMDPNITIERAFVSGGMLLIEGVATVSP